MKRMKYIDPYADGMGVYNTEAGLSK